MVCIGLMEDTVGDIYRVRSDWTGFLGGPGVTTMYFVDTATAVESVRTFFHDIANWLPTDVHINVESSGDTLDSSTGALTGTWVSDPSAVVDGSRSDTYAAPVGAVVDWLTQTVGPHRRLKGRSFLVPLSGGAFENNGTLAPESRNAIQTAATALVEAQSASFVVWHRGTGSDGITGLVTSATVPDMAAVLRSRRD